MCKHAMETCGHAKRYTYIHSYQDGHIGPMYCAVPEGVDSVESSDKGANYRYENDTFVNGAEFHMTCQNLSGSVNALCIDSK